MDRAAVNAICAAFPGATVSDPWGGGHDAWKVGDRLFAVAGADGRGVSVKTRDVETAEMLIDAGGAERAPYFHRSWVLMPWDRLEPDEARHRLRASYEIIRGGLPKKVRAALAPLPED